MSHEPNHPSSSSSQQSIIRRLGERVKELTALHSAVALLQKDHLSTQALLQTYAEALPPACQFPEIAQARIECNGHSAQTAGFKTTPWMLETTFEGRDGKHGLLQVAYLEEKPPADEGPFLKEERLLLNSLAELLHAGLARRTTADALRENEKRFRTLVTHSPDALYLHVDGVVTLANPAMCRLLGAPNEAALLGRSVFEIVHPDYHDLVRDRWKTVFSGHAAPMLHEKFVRMDGSLVDVEVNAVLLDLDGRKEVQVIARNITDRLQAEKQIRHLNRVYAVLSAINQTIVRQPDIQVVLETACRIAVERGGFQLAWIGTFDEPDQHLKVRAQSGGDQATVDIIQQLIDIDPPAGCAFTRRALTEGLHGVCNDIAADPLTEPWRKAALERNYLSMAAFPLMAGQHILGTLNLYAAEAGFFDTREVELLDELALDIGFALEVHRREQERLRVTTALQESESRFRAASEHAAIGMALVGLDGKWLQVNQSLCDFLGYTRDELQALDCQSVTHPEDLQADLAQVRKLIKGEIANYHMEKRYRHKEGREVWAHLSVALVRNASGEPQYFISQIQDITGRKNLEEQFRQAQKMESIGRLAGGIAHDFNNLLTVILGRTNFILKCSNLDPKLRKDVETLRRTGEFAADLTRQLLQFSRKQILSPKVLDLNVLLNDMKDMLRRLIGKNIEMHFHVAENLARVLADRSQMEQIILNLAVNARDAMPRGGMLTFETSNQFLDEHYAQSHPEVTPGPHVMLAICDTGSGMPPEVVEKIFEPFFTTKEVGEGTGMGLSTVHGIVKQSGGHVWVYSEIDQGTTFKIYLPVTNRKQDLSESHTRMVAVPEGEWTVLVVEDGQSVRDFITEALVDSGCRVLTAANGAEAMEIVRTHQGTIDLLLTDVVLPRMSGKDLAAEATKHRPDLRVLYMSGYTTNAIVHHGVLDPDVRFIEKPFTPEALTAKVNEVLREE